MWGQADSIFTSGLLACVYFVLTQREKFAFIALGLAFAMKLQAIFIAPVLALLFLKRLISWRGFLLIPVIYLISLLPSLAIGRPLVSLLTIYVDQANAYGALSLNAPNIYVWFPKESYDTVAVPGIIFGAAVIFLFVSLAYCSRAAVTAPLIIELMTFSVLISPYVFPRMHERYFFPADVFSIIFAFYFPRYVLSAIGVSLISVFTYLLYLLGNETIPLSILAIVFLFIIGTIGTHLVETLYGESGTQK
jgi:Gpi18-like mannosyltransferase